MTTAREIFERSLAVLGQEAGVNTESFENRAPKIITLLLAETAEINAFLQGKAESASSELPRVDSLEDSVDFDDLITLNLLPLGLAGFLIQEEETARGKLFLQLYETKRDTLRRNSRRGIRRKISRSF